MYSINFANDLCIAMLQVPLISTVSTQSEPLVQTHAWGLHATPFSLEVN